MTGGLMLRAGEDMRTLISRLSVINPSEGQASCHASPSEPRTAPTIEIHYEDHGSGQPVVLIHGYPLNGNSWERQERELLASGYRVISYDRRGFGRSSQPTVGLRLRHLRRRPERAARAPRPRRRRARRLLDGHRRGHPLPRHVRLGAACARRRCSARSRRSCSRPTTTPRASTGRSSRASRRRSSRTATPTSRTSSTTSTTSTCSAPDRISDRAWQASFNVAAGASPYATYACVDTWLTDFRADLPKIDVPMLVVHGTEDRILPFEATAARLPGADRRLHARPGRGRPAQHRLDAPRRGQRRAARVPRFVNDVIATARVSGHSG